MPGTAATAPAPDSDLVDDVEGTRASLVNPAGDQRVVALNSLPPGAREGNYVAGGQIVAPPPNESDAIRARLAAGDAGGMISLDDQPLAGASPGPGVGAPGAAAPAIPKLGPDGLPASSEDIQQQYQQDVAGEKKAMEGVSDAQQQGSEDVQKALQDKAELQRQQAADLAAEQLYTRERQQKLDDEDAANLEKAKTEVIPDFWQSREGELAASAITVGLAGFFGGALAGATGGQLPQNQVLQAIQHNIDSYSQRQADRINNLYKYAEAKGQLNDKVRSQYAGQLTDLMQQHAYLLQAAADRVSDVAEQAKSHVDQAQAQYTASQLNTRATDLLVKAREIDQKNYDSQTHREVADADMVRANAAMAKVHKGKGGGGGTAGTDWLTAMQSAAQEPGATPASVAAAAKSAGFHGKDNQLMTMAGKQIGDVEKQTGGVEKQMKDFETQLNGSGGKLGPAGQLGRIQAMKGVVADAVASGDPDRIKAAMTQIKEEAGGMLSGGKTTAYTGKMLDEAQSVADHLKESWSKLKGNPTEGAHFVSAITKLLGNVEQEKLAEVHEIRQKAVDQTLGPGGTANSPAAKRHAMARFKGITGEIKDANGNPVYQEGGAKPVAAAAGAPQEGATSVSAKGVPIVFRGGKWARQ